MHGIIPFHLFYCVFTMNGRLKQLLALITLTICVIFAYIKINSTYISQDGPGNGFVVEDVAVVETKKKSHLKNMTFHFPGAKLSFKEEKDLIVSMKLPSSKFTSLTPNMLHNITFVTAASANHFKESMDAIASVQTHFPGHKIIYYDIGLAAPQVTKLKTLCQVEYRPFPWAKYPRLSRKLLFYSGWKALTLKEVLIDHPAVFWIDACIRFVSPLPDTAITKIKQNGGVLLFHRVFHSTYAVTHPSMYNYLPGNITLLKTIKQVESGAMLFYQTEDIYYNVLWWFYLCSLEVQCISPSNSRKLGKALLMKFTVVIHNFGRMSMLRPSIKITVMKRTKGKRVPLVQDGDRPVRFVLKVPEQGFRH